MTKYLSVLLIACLPIISCGQIKNGKEAKGLIINKNIKVEVEKHIESSKEFDAFNDKISVYKNSLLVEAYENDKLIYSPKVNTPKQLFKSFYLWKGDTLKIDGGFGLFTGFGFTVNVYKNTATVYHLLSSDESPAFAYKEGDKLIPRLEVLCSQTKIILSELPDSLKNQTIYGYVEFKSDNYYVSSGTISGKETLPRKKQRTNMKIYFKSERLKI
ncbi:MAG TPA: hypothetical protein VL442_18170 [Mucilaginibacter sp.]|jgi:hypothetical protein|nr:hypothetical protein [Mucilaginibacter sp.]